MAHARVAAMTEGPDAALSRGGGVAAWRQIADAVERDIARGLLARGAQLPTEALLAARFGVNRHTVRRALADLARRGLVRASQGRGTFVEAPPLSYPIGERTRFSQIVGAQAREPRGRLVASLVEPADAGLAARLGLPEGTPLLRLVTVHTADEVPISSALAWFPQARFPRLAQDYEATGSLTRALDLAGLPDYRRRETRIGARAPSPEEARRLAIAPDRPVLTVESLNVDPEGVPIQVTLAVFAADRVTLVVEGP